MTRFLTAAILAFALITPAFAQETPCCASKDGTTLVINAQADVKAAPDIASISAGVLTTAKTASEALKENATKMNAVFAALKKAGIADKDMQTSGFNISPQYRYVENQAPEVVGYQASNNVNVLIRNLKEIGPVIDTLVGQGANQINGPTFSVEKDDALMDQARKDAMAKAKARADLYATAAGLKVKRIVSISEQANYATPPMPMVRMMAKGMAADSAAESSPVAAGELSLSVNVSVEYELQ